MRLPGSLTTAAPRNWSGCQTANAAPSGSVNAAIRPKSKMSNGSTTTLPPASRTLAAVSSALSTQMYVVQIAAAGASSCGGLMAATSPPPSRPMKYLPGAPAGIVFSNSQPNSPA